MYFLASIVKYLQFFKHFISLCKSTSLSIKCCRCHSGYGPPFVDLDPPTKLSFWASFLSYLVTNSICKLFCWCSFQSQHNISSIKVKKNKKKQSKSAEVGPNPLGHRQHSIERDVGLDCLRNCRYFKIEARKYTQRSAECSEIVI